MQHVSPPDPTTNLKAGVDLGRVRAVLAPLLSAHGVDLVDLAWVTERAGWTLRITIERPGSTDGGGGVTLADCSEVSRDASSILDVEDIIPHHYNLEVSSPGLERPLRTPEEFARFAGKLAKLKLAEPTVDGQKVLRGTLEAAPEGRVAVDVDGRRVEVPFASIVEAQLVFELNPHPKKKPGQARGRKATAGRTARSS
jgi:ribosome maturation factor RimP